MTRRVWVLPPTWSLDPEGSGGDGPKKHGRLRGGPFGRLRAKRKKPPPGGASVRVAEAPEKPPRKQAGGP